MNPHVQQPPWLQVIKRHVPAPIKRTVKEAWKQHCMSRCINELAGLPPDTVPERALLERLRFAWGNEGWSGRSEYLEEVIRYAISTAGPILECGSGLTTVVLGLLAGRRGIEVWSLEESRVWHARTAAALARYRIRGVRLCFAPLTDHGEYLWYSLPSGLPRQFTMVVCDGPGDYYESRENLLPILGDRLSKGASIVADDSAHMAPYIERWLRTMPLEPVSIGPQVAVLRVSV